jgi:hypothetical protein
MIAALKLRQKQLPIVAELFPEADFRRVVAGDRHRLDGLKELDADGVFPLRVPVFGKAREQGCLVRGARGQKVLAEEGRASLIDPGQNLSRFAADAPLSTLSMKRLTLTALAPGVSVSGMMSSVSVTIASFCQLVSTFGVHD